MDIIPFDQFAAVELRAGTVVRAETFPQARKPAYKIWVDFGPEFGVRQSSEQLTVHYTPESLIGKQIVRLPQSRRAEYRRLHVAISLHRLSRRERRGRARQSRQTRSKRSEAVLMDMTNNPLTSIGRQAKAVAALLAQASPEEKKCGADGDCRGIAGAGGRNSRRKRRRYGRGAEIGHG